MDQSYPLFLAEFVSRLYQFGGFRKDTNEWPEAARTWQYSGNVQFVQTIKLKVKFKTTTSGSVEFLACTDEKCLLLREVAFSLQPKIAGKLPAASIIGNSRQGIRPVNQSPDGLNRF